MRQTFDPKANAHVSLDDDGVVRGLVQDVPLDIRAPSARGAADEYLRTNAGLLGVAPKELASLSAAAESQPVAAGTEYRLRDEKSQFDTTTVTYDQTLLGLPVWEAGVSVVVKDGGKTEPFRVVGANSTLHADLTGTTSDAQGLQANLEQSKRIGTSLDADTLARLLALEPKSPAYDRKSLRIDEVTLVVYRYEAAKRQPDSGTPGDKDGFAHTHPVLPLPPVPASIKEGKHYVSALVHFQLGTPELPELNWRAMIDVDTGAVLHLRPFVDGVTGMVFNVDPMSSTPTGPLPNAPTANLNAKRTSVTLLNLNAPSGGVQSLTGSLVSLADVELPTLGAPTRPVNASFDYDSRSDDFAAVNAYYHSDRFFRLVQSLGFSLPSYFGPTPFPSPTDHRGLGGNVVNAHCVGMPGGVGIKVTAYALADTGNVAQPIGIACDWRVVLHELGGHGILYPHVHSPNFGFAHSAGDSFAAILNDAGSAAADRFVTFPWVNIGRRHDRPVNAGWAWGGTNDVGGYSSEQILCTTHFRIYRSIGGDAALPNGLGQRQFAARFVSYLILRTVGSLTPATNPSNVSGYAAALLTADLGDWTSEGHAGGAYGKVIRWAFEKQGLFQPAGAPKPVTTQGAPPDVDVYIEDGRHGEYPYQPVHWDCHAIWNRRQADGQTTHENPVVGKVNYAYVKIKNRGTKPATNVVVKAFHALPAAGLTYPNDWLPMTTAQLAAPNVPPNSSSEIVVGPFKWTPTQVGHECMFMIVSALGDQSNVGNLSAGESFPEWRLVPNDNNIGQRNVTPVAFAGVKEFAGQFPKLGFTIKNPHRTAAKMVLTPVLPPLLAQRGWKLLFPNVPADGLRLEPGKTAQVTLQLQPAKEVTVKEVAAERDRAIRVQVWADGILVGGMTYEIEPTTIDPKRGFEFTDPQHGFEFVDAPSGSGFVKRDS